MSFPAVTVQLNGDKTDVHNIKTSYDSSWTQNVDGRRVACSYHKWEIPPLNAIWDSGQKLFYCRTVLGALPRIQAKLRTGSYIFIDPEVGIILLYKNVCVHAIFSYMDH